MRTVVMCTGVVRAGTKCVVIWLPKCIIDSRAVEDGCGYDKVCGISIVAAI